ncbi:MAG: winged helix-turn-helix domain-containing protein [Prevotella sp.]|nr:winged helix-turn-helix domain-containing protein [Prevotella sp.]
MVLNPERQLVTINGNEIRLTTKEAELLELLSENKGNLVDRKIALERIWDKDTYYAARSMDVYITKLRKILRPLNGIVEIKNVHGKGYRLIVSDTGRS